MEFLNRIELRGVVGSVQITPINGTKVARFSLATEYCYKSNNGGVVIDTTWFSCTAWQGDKITCLDSLQKGSRVHIIGRVRMQRYVDASGNNREIWEIVASELEILEG